MSVQDLPRPAGVRVQGGTGPLAAPVPAIAAGVVTVALLLFTFRDGIREMVRVWDQPEYSHGYLIPFLALYALLIRLPALRRADIRQSWTGVAILGVALVAYVIGELSALFIIVQYGFLLAVWGAFLAFLGLGGLRALWASLAFLVFMVPLPFFIQYAVSAQLQLVSSELGTFFLRAVGVPVFVEGNVIDLGIYKLQVVEACSGLRYLFPLMCFGFLCALLFKGPLWQRWLIFLSSVPITIVMNSFRIAVTGLMVNRFGIEAAEGFLHFFEGWIIFTACLALMFLEMMLLALGSGRRLADVFDVDIPQAADFQGWRLGRISSAPVIGAVTALLAGAVLSLILPGRDENIPRHASLATFPLAIGAWAGVDGTISEQELGQLKLTEYALINYRHPGEPAPVDLYVAYYESQRKGVSAHSPRACLPGSGWEMQDFRQITIDDVGPDGEGIPVNRAVIAKGPNRFLVYYWFPQRGRNLTNEYAVKFYIFWDSLTRSRTDGALVRVITPIGNGQDVEAADQRLASFIRQAHPRLSYHLPGWQTDGTDRGTPVAAR